MAEASVKGIILRLSADRVRRHLESGKLEADAALEWLDTGDLDLLESRVHLAFWYPVTLHDRFMRCLRDFEGAGDDRYWVEFGRDSVESIAQAPASGAIIDGAAAFGTRAGVALVRLADLCFNFGSWAYRGESLEHFEIEASDAAALPISIQISLEGFIATLATRLAGVEVRCTSERSSADRILFTARPR